MRILLKTLLFLSFSFLYSNTYSQLPPIFDNDSIVRVRKTDLTTKYLSPVRIVWTSDNNGNKYVKNASAILKQGIGQADLNPGKYLKLVSDKDNKGGIILDFGHEIQGGEIGRAHV